MRSPAVLLCSTLVLASGLFAQTQAAQAKSDPLRYVPKNADVVVRTVGPAAWQREFVATRLGMAIADPQLLPTWTQLLAFFETQARLEGRAQDLDEASAAWDALKDYSGDIVFAGRAAWDSMDDVDDLLGAAVLALGSDGQSDMAKLAALLSERIPGEKAGELELGGVPAGFREVDGMQFLGPVVHDGSVVLLIGQDLEERATWFFEDTADKAATNELRGPSLALNVNFERVLEKFLESNDEMSTMPSWFMVQFGIAALKEFTFAISADGKHVRQEMQMKFGGEERGLLAAFLPERNQMPGLLGYLPAGAGTYSAAPMDLSIVKKVYNTVFEKHADDLPMGREDFEGMFADMTNLDLFKDVFDHLGDEYMRIDDMAAQLTFDDEDPEELADAKERVGEACYVIKLTNGRAFAKSLDTAIRARGLHVGRKREDYNGTNIYRMNLLGMLPIEYSVTDTLLLVGIGEGEGIKKHLRSVLDAAAAGGAAAAPAFSKEVTERMNGMRVGWGGIEVGSLVEILEGLIATGETVKGLLADEGMTLDDVEDPWQLIMDGSSALKTVLARHKAGVVVNLDYFEKDRYVMRSRW